MADVFKTFIKHMNGVNKAAIADAAAKAMSEHCDMRITKARKAIDREEKYLRKLIRSKSAGGVMAGDVEGAFARLRTAMELPNG